MAINDVIAHLDPDQGEGLEGPSQGGGADFNVEPQNVVMRYIICATDA